MTESLKNTAENEKGKNKHKASLVLAIIQGVKRTIRIPLGTCSRRVQYICVCMSLILVFFFIFFYFFFFFLLPAFIDDAKKKRNEVVY